MNEQGSAPATDKTLAQLVEERWQRGERPDPEGLVADAAGYSLAEVAAALAVDQWHRWQAGQRLPAEEYFARHPVVMADLEAALVLAYGEFIVREEIGDAPRPEDYLKRFPQLASALRNQFELHAGLARFAGNTDPHPPANAESLDPATTPARRLRADRFTPGTLIANRYRIVAALGKGGMGEVYRADDVRLGQTVALKFLPLTWADNPDWLVRFRNEVRIARQVSHPNVCRVYDLGEEDGLLFLTMEYIDGEDLASLLRRIGRLPENKGIELARQLCLGLAAVHDKGVLHRDLKPHNVMVDGSGQARLTDFGLAAFAEEVALSQIKHGTPAYQAPEQSAGLGVSVQSDLYSLGLVLYEAFTGKRPFGKGGRGEAEAPDKPSSHVTTLDPAVDRVVLRCLKQDPHDRPRSARAVAAGLPGADPLEAALAAGETPSPEMVVNATREGVTPPLVAAALLAAVLIGLAVIALAKDETATFRRVPLEDSPDVLVKRAREVILRLGYNRSGRTVAFRFYTHRPVLDYVTSNDDSPTRWQFMAEGRPAIYYFGYRESPNPYPPRRATLPPETSLPDDPLPDQVGLTQVLLDTKGRLVRFTFVAPTEEADNPPIAPDWRMLFVEAGLDMNAFRATASRGQLPVGGDIHVAWVGEYPEMRGTALRIEAAAYRGKPVYFRMLGPWDERPSGSGERAAGEEGTDFIWIGLVGLVLVAGGALAWSNWWAGRADRRGALRLAIYIFILQLLTWFLGEDHVRSVPIELALLWTGLGKALFLAGVMWVAYFAVEPLVRRRWPWRIVSWKRALEGRFRDPLVGRDILIGCVLGVAGPLIFWIGYPVVALLGLPPMMPTPIPPRALTHITFTLIDAQGSSLFDGLLFTFAFFLIAVLARRQWLAIAIVLFLTIPFGLSSRGDFVFHAIFSCVSVSLSIFVAMRYGIFPLLVGMFIGGVLGTPITTDWTTWYRWSTISYLAVVVGLAVYGFFVCKAGRPLVELKE